MFSLIQMSVTLGRISTVKNKRLPEAYFGFEFDVSVLTDQYVEGRS